MHKEESTGQGYTGDNVLTRAQHYGYPQRSMAEVITHRTEPAAAVADSIDSAYHLFPLLRTDLVALGYGDAHLGPITVQVMYPSYRDKANRRTPPPPAANHLSRPTAFNGNHQ